MRGNSMSSGVLRYITVFTLLIVLLLAGCNKEPVSNNESTDDSKNGGTLRVGLSPVSGNLINLGYAGSYRGANELFVAATSLEMLTKLNEKGEIDPWLAENWETDIENATITFKLKEGVKFHDGTDFNAEAVKWNIDQALEANSVEFQDVKSADVIDEYTLRVNLKEWNSSMLGIFATFLTIYSPAASEENGGKDFMMTNLVGTGPFEFESFKNDVSVKFKKFKDYWQSDKPLLDAVEFFIYQDEMSLEASFQANEIDVVYAPSLQLVKNVENIGEIAELKSGLGSSINGIITDSSNPSSPFHDVRVRKALGYAIDTKAIQKTITHGYAIETNQYAAPQFWSFNPNLEGTNYDPEKAKQLLEEAGYPNGFKTKINTVASYVDPMTSVQAYLAEVGIDAEIEVADPGKMDQMISPQGGWDGIMNFSIRAEPDVALYVPRYFSENATRFGANIIHPENIKSLLVEAKMAVNLEESKGIAHKLQKAMFDEHALATPFWLSTRPSVLSKTVHDSGINITHATTWTPYDAWIER